VDPVTADANLGTNFNRYWYANNNPYMFTDPDGRFGQCATPGSCAVQNAVEQVQRAAEKVADAAAAVGDVIDKYDVRLEAGAALGIGVEGEISLLRGDGEIGMIMVGEGADISISVQPREGFTVNFADKPVDAPISFEGAGEVKAGAVLHGGVEAEFNPGGSVEVTPKAGVGAGELVKYSPSVKFVEWGNKDKQK
jgi:hypothetical protein